MTTSIKIGQNYLNTTIGLILTITNVTDKKVSYTIEGQVSMKRGNGKNNLLVNVAKRENIEIGIRENRLILQ